MERFIRIETMREAYSKSEAAERSMTIGEFIEVLQELESEAGSDAKMVLSFDRGYTYGGIKYDYLTIEGDGYDDYDEYDD